MFAPNSAHRAQLTPAKRGQGNKARTADAAEDTTPTERRAAMTWAQRLKRAFNIDIKACNSCGGHIKIIACIEDPVVIEKLLTHIDNKAACGAVRRLPPCRAPPQVSPGSMKTQYSCEKGRELDPHCVEAPSGDGSMDCRYLRELRKMALTRSTPSGDGWVELL